MTTTLALAFEKLSSLSAGEQERIGLRLLDHIAAVGDLKAEIQIGIDQADAGLCADLDMEKLISELNEEHASA